LPEVAVDLDHPTDNLVAEHNRAGGANHGVPGADPHARDCSRGSRSALRSAAARCPKASHPTSSCLTKHDTDGEVPMIGLTTADLKKRSKKSCLFGSWRPRLKPASLAFSTSPAVSKVTKIQYVVTRFGKLHSGSVYGGWLVCTPCMMRCQAKSISRLEERAVVRWRVSPRCEHSREP